MTHHGTPARLDLSAFRARAAAFARELRPGEAVALHGELGAGKTTFVRAVVAELHGSDDEVASPTFTFRRTYDGTPPIEHLDLYRVDDAAELAELGVEEAFGPHAVAFVEWPAILGERFAPAWSVTISGAGDEERTVTVERLRTP